MKRSATLVLLLFFCCSGKAQQIPVSLLDSITITGNNGTYPNIDGVAITQRGKLIFETYFHGLSKDSLHDSRSSLKSVTGILLGIAIEKGFIKSLQEKVYTFFPEYKPYENWNILKDSMTIEHLVAMKSGFDCEEWDGSKDCEDDMENERDWIKFCLDLPLKNKPGTHWDYTSINTMLLGGVIAHASHMTVSDFADKYLFKPLGITKYRWTKDPVGHEMTAGSFYISPRDMNKIGQLILNGGVFNDKRLVPQKWVEVMTEKHLKIENFSNVRISKNKAAIPQPTYYGYAWYNEEVRTEKFKHNIVFASGNGGQYIMVIKDLDLVVTFTGNSYNSSRSKLPFDLMIKYILPYFSLK
ncbi:serine hydrolase domain-containing protein [Dyadobacter diqingensis]|uniref:serine hydrolase domain-containing protein n=1 Tax=Dyadobacter diqingensis TaxID=2938121 RepID=UPI0020C2FD71|nr:serine hydrolase [Dyadobacter diqingensis]